jgi:hypothetical protein
MSAELAQPQTVPARQFKSVAVVAFTYVSGMLVGRVKSNGRVVEFNISAQEVTIHHIEQAGWQDLEAIKSALRRRGVI